MSKKRNPRVQITFRPEVTGIELIRRGLEMIPRQGEAEALRHILSSRPQLAEDLILALTTPLVK